MTRLAALLLATCWLVWWSRDLWRFWWRERGAENRAGWF